MIPVNSRIVIRNWAHYEVLFVDWPTNKGADTCVVYRPSDKRFYPANVKKTIYDTKPVAEDEVNDIVAGLNAQGITVRVCKRVPKDAWKKRKWAIEYTAFFVFNSLPVYLEEFIYQ